MRRALRNLCTRRVKLSFINFDTRQRFYIPFLIFKENRNFAKMTKGDCDKDFACFTK